MNGVCQTQNCKVLRICGTFIQQNKKISKEIFKLTLPRQSDLY